MRYWSYAVSRKIVVYHVIFFFILTPLLASCSSSGDTDGTNFPSGTNSVTGDKALTDAVDDQNRSAQTAISGVVDMAMALDSGRNLIEGTFGTMSPSQEDIEDFVENNPDGAADLMDQLKALAVETQSAANKFNTSIEELKDLENIIVNSLGGNNDATAAVANRDAQALGLIGGALVLLTVIGGVAAAGKGAADAMHECDDLPECNPMPDATDPGLAECMKWKAEKLACMITKWPKAAGDAIKGTISTGVTTVASWAAGVQEWKAVKFLIDAYSNYDSTDSIKKAFGIRRCDQTDSSMINRQLQAVNIDTLTPDDVYIGTSQNGTFYNVPQGDWTFLLLEDGHLRKTSQCIDATGESPIEAHVTLIPLEAMSDDDQDGYSEIQGDCNDQNAGIHPDALEDCKDNIDNNCNMLIDCFDSQCDTEPSCLDSPSEATVSVNVTINGYGTYSPNFFQGMGLGTCSQKANSLFPVIMASSDDINSDPLTSDFLSIFLNDELEIGTLVLGTGPCDFPEVDFHTQDIRDQGSNTPVVFSSYDGHINIEENGTGYGDRLKGSFSVQVMGKQQLCPTSECDVDKEITGTISGSFDGIITNYTPGN